MMLKPIGMFATPESSESLTEYCNSFGTAAERQVALTVMGMTWNLCAKLVQDSQTTAEKA